MTSWRSLDSFSSQDLVYLGVGIVECSVVDVFSVYLLTVPFHSLVSLRVQSHSSGDNLKGPEG